MCGSMVDIQSPTAEVRQEKKKKPQGKNTMVCPIPQGDHKEERPLPRPLFKGRFPHKPGLCDYLLVSPPASVLDEKVA